MGVLVLVEEVLMVGSSAAVAEWFMLCTTNRTCWHQQQRRPTLPLYPLHQDKQVHHSALVIQSSFNALEPPYHL